MVWSEFRRTQLQAPELRAVLVPFAQSRNWLFRRTTGAAPGAAEYWNWGMNVPAAFTLTVPRIQTLFCVAAAALAVTLITVATVDRVALAVDGVVAVALLVVQAV